MRITEVAIGVHDLDEAAGIWGGVLQVPFVRHGDAVVARIGATTLRMECRPGAETCEHLAITVAPGALPAARTWLEERTALFARDGLDEFEGPAAWDSRSVYFAGPSRAVLELIERRRLPMAHHAGPFGADGLLGISEVGVAVDDVPAAVRRLGLAGLHPFAGSSGQDFAAVGDEEGMLILATTGRAWLPTEDRLAALSRTRITASAGRAAELDVGAAHLCLTA